MEHKDPRQVLNKSGGTHPLCFKDSKQYTQWMLLLQMSGESKRAGYCLDCTPEYKHEMMACGRCEHPETRFMLRSDPHHEDSLEWVGVSGNSIYRDRLEMPK